MAVGRNINDGHVKGCLDLTNSWKDTMKTQDTRTFVEYQYTLHLRTRNSYGWEIAPSMMERCSMVTLDFEAKQVSVVGG